MKWVSLLLAEAMIFLACFTPETLAYAPSTLDQPQLIVLPEKADLPTPTEPYQEIGFNIHTELITLHHGLYPDYKVCNIYLEGCLIAVLHFTPENAYRAAFAIPTVDAAGRTVKSTDAAGAVTHYEYDAAGRTLAVIDNNGNRTENTYDAAGRQTSMKDALGHVYQYQYDALGRRVKTIMPDGTFTTVTYNTLGQLKKKTDFLGIVTEFDYDSLGRMEYKKHYAPGSTTADETVQLVYDDLGRQKEIIEARGTTTFNYDIDGRLTSLTTPEGTVHYEYESDTGRKIKTWTNNSETAYGYDELGRLKTVTVNKRNGSTLADPEVTTYSYTKVGSRETMILPNGCITGYVYNDLNRLTRIRHADKDDKMLAQYDYSLAPNGRRTGIVEKRLESDGTTYSDTTIAYGYDNLNRLVSESSTSTANGLSFSATYSYDLVGNRMQKTKTVGGATETIDYSYNPNDQLTLESSSVEGDTSYAYNENGSMTHKVSQTGTYTYQYSLQNRLSDVTVNRMEGLKTVEIDAQYVYNQGGMRVKSTSTRKIDGVTSNTDRVFLLDSGLTGYAQVLEELNSSGSVTKSYVLGDDTISQTVAGQTRFFAMDGHGSTRLLTDEMSAVTDRFDYDAYGNKLGDEVNLTNPVATDLLYTGEQFDPELGDTYLRARYYNARNGRFNRVDPFAGNNSDPQSLHKYNYCHGDPVNYLDPTGESIVEFLVNVAIRSILFNMVGKVLAPIKNRVLGKFIPTYWKTIVRSTFSWPDAFLIGISGFFGHAALRGVGGIEGLISLHNRNFAVYSFYGATIHGLWGRGIGAGVSFSVGAVWNCRNSRDYEGPFWSFTLSYGAVPDFIKGWIETALSKLIFQRYKVNALYFAMEKYSRFSGYNDWVMDKIDKIVSRYLNKVSATFIWWPGGAVGVTLNFTVGSQDTSTASVGYSEFTQFIPDDRNVRFRD